MRKKILVIHGPNLNLLGEREPEFYGKTSLESINKKMSDIAEKNNIVLEIYQTNYEGEIVEIIHKKRTWADLIVINPAAYTHTSIAVRDALLAVKIPVIEVHLSNIYSRESFRHKSMISDIALGVISGFGEESYFMALDAAKKIIFT
ncbi:type II 3-dehydroquinate dehydratase [Candidatus Desantisbacteria bacterium]|nr:type II 3-dehydroquinate dehydratase [Candidatus Desantisbacteria bacterium]